jgi:glutaredoxin 3
MMERSGRRTVPQIFIGDHHVGGFDDLAELDAAGELDGLLS